MDNQQLLTHLHNKFPHRDWHGALKDLEEGKPVQISIKIAIEREREYLQRS